ncbi:MAG TPA: NAD(P)H-dependent oxidoreductase [Burkholderiales bacterium]|jgi:FMN-dependent NADH-azoreductase|nr:NAD(P)H-dependent oxidoreductase [Burkholderiales bacterium]
MKTLQINSSIFGAGGQSSQLADKLVAGIGGDVVVRDLARDPVPHLDAERFGAFLAKPGARTAQQQAVIDYSDRLIGELREADTIVIALPMYNFGVPSMLRAYFDHVARAGVTFKYTEKGPVGLLTGKKAYVFVTRGGVYGEKHAHTDYVRDFLAFLGITDVTFIHAEGLAISEPSKQASLVKARNRIAELELIAA